MNTETAPTETVPAPANTMHRKELQDTVGPLIEQHVRHVLGVNATEADVQHAIAKYAPLGVRLAFVKRPLAQEIAEIIRVQFDMHSLPLDAKHNARMTRVVGHLVNGVTAQPAAPTAAFAIDGDDQASTADGDADDDDADDDAEQ